MGFLSGVLDAVKDDDAVKTYDKIISDKNKRLKSVLKLVDSNIGSGRNGLVASVGVVKGWLEGYGNKLDEKTGEVTKHLDTLSKNIETNISSVSRLRDFHAVWPKWRDTVIGDMGETMFGQVTDAIGQLDNSLQIKLKSDFEHIKTRIQALSDSAEREQTEMKELNDSLQTELRDLQQRVIKEAQRLRDGCIHGLKNEFDKHIQKPLKIVHEMLKIALRDLDEWHKKAISVVNAASQKVNDILTLIGNGSEAAAKNAVKEAADALYQKAFKLLSAIHNAKDKLSTMVTTATRAVNKMDEELKGELYTVKTQISQRINNYIKEILLDDIRTKVGIIKVHVGENVKGDAPPNNQSIDRNWEQLKDEIETFVSGKIINGGEGLLQIKEGIVRYVARFHKDGKDVDAFGGIVQDWIKNILESNEVVKESLNAYMKDYGSRFKMPYNREDSNRTQRIATVIMEALKTNVIDKAIAASAVDLDSRNDSEITQNFKKVQAVCSTFAEKLDEQIRGANEMIQHHTVSGITVFAKSLSLKIEMDTTLGLQKSADPYYDNSELLNAVAATLCALSATARHIAAEIKRFNNDCKLNTNLEKGIEKLLQISDKLEKDKGAAITEALNTVKNRLTQLNNDINTAIEQKHTVVGIDSPYDVYGKINNILTNNIGTDEQFAVLTSGKVILSDTFSTYKKHVDSSQSAISSHPNGYLLKAISSVTSQVNQNLESIYYPNGQKIDDNNLDTAIFSFNTNLVEFIKSIRELLVKKTVSTSGDVPEADRGVQNLLEDMHGMLGNNLKRLYQLPKGLAGIRAAISRILETDTGGNLREIVNQAEEFYSRTADNNVTDCISGVTHFLSKQITEKNINIRADALRRYVESAKQQLTELKAYVIERSKNMQILIQAAKESGVMGLLNESRGKTDPPGDKIIPGVKQAPDWLEALNRITDLKESEKFTTLSQIFKSYLGHILSYTIKDVKRVFPDSSPSPGTMAIPHTYSSEFEKLKNAVNTLLDYFIEDAYKRYNFDESFNRNVEALENSLNSLSPVNFGEHAYLNLDSVTAGLKAFIKELRCAYVSTYSGATTDWSREDNPDKKNCAKVCLTTLCMLYSELTELRTLCNKSRQRQINLSTDLGLHLKRCGYQVSANTSSHDGELRNCSELDGYTVRSKITKAINGANDIKHIKACKPDETAINVMALLSCLCSHLNEYYETCHLSTLTSKKQPCSAYEMLCWLTGLPHTPVYASLLPDALPALLESDKPKSYSVEDIDVTVVDHESLYVDTYPKRIMYRSISDALEHICLQSYDVITTIAGFGDDCTVYACDLFSNYLRLSYPSDPSQCLDSLLDVLRRLFPVMEYLRVQCQLTGKQNGWYNCKYGKNVKYGKWPCNEHPTDEPTCQPNSESTCEPNCQPTSPLMSYLNDCLPGHLPHQLSDIGCKPKCGTCPKSPPGTPCLTPLGFRGFSGSTREGKDICDVISKLLGNDYFARLLSVVSKPPSTLPEHFGFALSFVNYWHYGLKFRSLDVNKPQLQEYVEKSIRDVSINLYVNPTDLVKKFIDTYGSISASHVLCEDSHLMNLTGNDVCYKRREECSPYISSLCTASYHHLAYKNSKTYLYWAIYLPWTFWDLLNNLYNAFCSINCQDWGCRGCLRGDKCKKGEHGVVDEDKPNNKCQCSSIVDCKGVAPTLYQYGFVFGEASTLNGESPKKCSDFCTQLKKVLESKYFEKLFEECDNFLWQIRLPFSYLVLALWSLSLFYLICVMVGRLDVLHIKSHLHRPSSHRIAAQSLLAAGRVNKLNRVFYLQP